MAEQVVARRGPITVQIDPEFEQVVLHQAPGDPVYLDEGIARWLIHGGLPAALAALRRHRGEPRPKDPSQIAGQTEIPCP